MILNGHAGGCPCATTDYPEYCHTGCRHCTCRTPDYLRGVDAAREAVFDTTVGFGIAVDAPVVVAYLAAIDALKDTHVRRPDEVT